MVFTFFDVWFIASSNFPQPIIDMLNLTKNFTRNAALVITALITLSGATAMSSPAPTPPELPMGFSDSVTTISVIPVPSKVALKDGFFRLVPETRLIVADTDAALRPSADFLRSIISPASGYTLPVVKSPVPAVHPDAAASTSTITFQLAHATAKLGDEGYHLTVTHDTITIEAQTDAGAFYAVQTLRQLLPVEMETGPAGTLLARGWAVPALDITDTPRYAWRGMMLDSARHMQTKEFTKQFLDIMAMQKLNVFHWHFIDNNAWRMEVESYPRLITMAAFRGPAGHRYGGYYSKDDIREIVAHAKARHINVVPEFEMPAHSSAALAAYPELSCAATEHDFLTTPGANDSLGYFARAHGAPFCAGNEDVFKFHAAIFDEALELFPSKVWHVGGDERPKGHWDKCPKCQKLMKDENLADEHALQEWFMKRISDILAKRGKRAISWAVTRSDAYNPTDMDSLGNNAIIMNWHDGTRFAATQGWDVVNANNVFLYFDYPETDVKNKPDWMPILPLDKVYGFDFTPADLPSTATKHIIGGEACLWTETVPQALVSQRVFPRMCALAEIAWSPAESKDFTDFQRRLEVLRMRLEKLGMKFNQPPASE